MEVSLSFIQGAGHVAHNEREFSRSNVDRSRSGDNIYRRSVESLEQAYADLFGQAIDAYNEGQTRPDRKKTVEGYLDEIKVRQTAKNGEKPFYEVIVMLGDKDTCGILNHPQEAAKAKETLMEYLDGWAERNPNLHIYSASLHMDEATPHLHIDYIPVASGYKRGLGRRNSLSKALEQQGIENDGKMKENALTAWQRRERVYLADLARKRGLEVKKQGIQREHLSVQEYERAAQRLEKEAQALPEVGRSLGPISILTKKDREILREQQYLTAKSAAAVKLQAATLTHQKKIDRLNLRERSKRLDAREIHLGNKEIDLDRRERSLDEKSREAEKIRNDLQARQNALTAKETEAERKKQELADREKILRAQEKSWKEEHETRAAARAADIAAAKEAAEQRRSADLDRQKAAEQKKAALAELARVRSDLEQSRTRLSLMEAREMAVTARETAVGSRERSVAAGLERISAWDNDQEAREQKREAAERAEKQAQERAAAAEQQRAAAAAELARITASLSNLRAQQQAEEAAAKTRAAARKREEEEHRRKIDEEARTAKEALRAELDAQKEAQEAAIRAEIEKSLSDRESSIKADQEELQAEREKDALKKAKVIARMGKNGFTEADLSMARRFPGGMIDDVEKVMTLMRESTLRDIDCIYQICAGLQPQKLEDIPIPVRNQAGFYWTPPDPNQRRVLIYKKGAQRLLEYSALMDVPLRPDIEKELKEIVESNISYREFQFSAKELKAKPGQYDGYDLRENAVVACFGDAFKDSSDFHHCLYDAKMSLYVCNMLLDELQKEKTEREKNRSRPDRGMGR